MTGTLDAIGPALQSLGDDLHTVIARMTQALDAAKAGGLDVTGTVIHCPTEMPPVKPVGMIDMATEASYLQETNRYNQRQKAWTEVVQTCVAARGQEHAAHEKFKAAASKSHFDIKGLTGVIGKDVGYALTFAGGVNQTTAAFAQDALLKRGIANAAVQAVKNNPTMLTNGQIGVVMQSLKNTETAAGKATLWNKYARIYPEPLRAAAAYAPADLIRNLDRVPIAKRIPIIGTVVSAATTEASVEQGKDPGTEWTKFGIDTAEGALVSEGIAATIPGPGWAYAIGVAAGIPLAHVTDEIIDNWDNVKNTDVGEVAEELNKKTEETGINQWDNHR